jgi:hypothetical protein
MTAAWQAPETEGEISHAIATKAWAFADVANMVPSLFYVVRQYLREMQSLIVHLRLAWPGPIQSAQERIPAPVPSDDDGEEMTYDQARLVRRFRKGGRPSTALGLGSTNLKALNG